VPIGSRSADPMVFTVAAFALLVVVAARLCTLARRQHAEHPSGRYDPTSFVRLVTGDPRPFDWERDA
jgi:hypothetical protein